MKPRKEPTTNEAATVTPVTRDIPSSEHQDKPASETEALAPLTADDLSEAAGGWMGGISTHRFKI